MLRLRVHPFAPVLIVLSPCAVRRVLAGPRGHRLVWDAGAHSCGGVRAATPSTAAPLCCLGLGVVLGQWSHNIDKSQTVVMRA